MVKGVNKTVIEVNNTGSKVFDRIVFYINPTCSNLNPKYLKKAMQNFSFQFDGKAPNYKTIRQKRLMRKRIIVGAIVATISIVTAVTLLLVL